MHDHFISSRDSQQRTPPLAKRIALLALLGRSASDLAMQYTLQMLFAER